MAWRLVKEQWLWQVWLSINAGAKIGNGCIVNTSSSIDYDCTVGDYVLVAVVAHLCGAVTVGNMTWIGAETTVSNNVNICGGCTIGAGAVVIKVIEEEGTYIAVSAKMISKNKLTGGECSTRIKKKSSIMYHSVVVHNLQHRRAA